MRLDDWLSRAAEAVPRQPALIAGERTMTFAELEREAVARGAPARRPRGAAGRPRGAVCRALDRARRAAARPREAGRGGGAARPERPRTPSRSALLGSARAGAGGARAGRGAGRRLSRADAALDDVARLRRAALRDPHLRHEREPEGRQLTYGNHLWNAVGSGVRIGVSPIGPLALLPAAAPRRRLRDPRARGAVPDRDRARALRRRTRSPQRSSRAPRDDRLARADDARAPAGRGRSARARCAVPLIGGGPLPQPLLERALDAGVPVAPTYGLTECASQVATMSPGEARERPGSRRPADPHHRAADRRRRA